MVSSGGSATENVMLRLEKLVLRHPYQVFLDISNKILSAFVMVLSFLLCFFYFTALQRTTAFWSSLWPQSKLCL